MKPLTLFLLLTIPLLAGCDFLFDDDEEPACKGDLVLTVTRHSTASNPPSTGEPVRHCYTLGEVRQTNVPTIDGGIDFSLVYVEFNAPSIGNNQHAHHHSLTFKVDGKDFFEADPSEITVGFRRLDANKNPIIADHTVVDYDLSIDPIAREISFSIHESHYYTSNYVSFVYEPYEFENITVPEIR